MSVWESPIRYILIPVGLKFYDMITVAIPVWDSKDIIWLPMESLCRQETSEPWELIVYEEAHQQQCGEPFFASYMNRLKESGCVGFKYLTADTKLPLSYKWEELGKASSGDSKMFCICDADNYYQKFMIQDTADAYKLGYDWLTAKRGFFYNFASCTLAEYSLHERPASKTGLQMSIATKLIKKLPRQEKHRLLNAWVFNNCKPQKRKDEDKHLNTLCTHGHNHISTKRGKMIDNFEVPFYKTDVQLNDILPEDVEFKLKELCKK